ncbi:NnrU family protein [Phyllobacterium salinisoli]|uniref:NnrU family protein n=1 Tax=Phyllobacterium salinisoli TaxID=1899321 RepID=A0A368K219_9HYPH|nr:NnrU family protein [Phyllobacterium salinisoli]RCS23429.1 NnrU family protein [Phyllobacterium salinisoli]
MLVMILGLLIFLGIHSVQIVAPQWRKAKIAEWGGGKWKGFYSLVAAIGFVLIVWGFSLARPTAPFLYEPPVWMKHITLLLMMFSFIFLAMAEMPAGRLKPKIRHPMLVGVKIWALAHLLANGDLASLILFLSVLAWAVWDRIAIKRRERAEGAAVIASGPVVNDVLAVIVGLAIYILFVWKLHEWLIGVSPT